MKKYLNSTMTLRLATVLFFLLIRTIRPGMSESFETSASSVENVTQSGELENATFVDFENFDIENVTTSTLTSMINFTSTISSTSTSLPESTMASTSTSTPLSSSDEDTTTIVPESNSTTEESPPAPPLPPQKLYQSPLSSLLSGESSETLQDFLKSRGFTFPTDPLEVNKLLSRLKPKQGRFDPALLDIINNKNLPLPGIFREDPKKLSSTEKNSWTPIPGVVTKPPSLRRKFSSKFSTTRNVSTTSTSPPPETLVRPVTTTSTPPPPFSHITDPNLRNHRLFDAAAPSPDSGSWEFETYENFTHIDQAEDLLAQSSEGVPPTFVKAPENARVNKRPVSMEGTEFDSSGDLKLPEGFPPDTYLKFESEEPFNLLRPREPLRQSSTENLVFTERDRFRSQERFRASPKDKGLSPPVFVDPDQDFFTSTIRSNDNNPQQEDNFQPQRFRNRKRNNNKFSEEAEEPFARRRRPFVSEEAVTDLAHDPRPYPPPLSNSDEHRDRPRNPGVGAAGTSDLRKSDRILSQSKNHPYYPNQNQYGPASNEFYPEEENYGQMNFNSDPQLTPSDPQQEYNNNNNNNYSPAKSGLVLGHNGQEYPGGYETQFHHPFAEEDSQAEYSHYPPNSSEGWTSTYWILGGLIVLSTISAFILPTVLNSMGRNGKIRNDLEDIDNLEYADEQASSSSSVSSLFTKKPSQSSSSNDGTYDTDLWTEIKGVYNDVVKIVRGDYGGIVNKLSKKVKNKDKVDGPNIVYRDDENISDPGRDDIDLEDLDDLELEEDYSVRNRNRLNKRKGKTGSKKKTINSSINYVVTSEAEPSRSGSTPRGVPLDDTMATFYLGGSTSRGPFNHTHSPQGPDFMGEWAKVQLIGS